MGIIVGSLARQNWHRQARQRGLSRAAAEEAAFEKTAAIGREFGFQPMGIDIDYGAFGTGRDALEALKARLAENGMVPVASFGPVVVSNDALVREANLEQVRRELEEIAVLGARTATFHVKYHGRVTREGQVRFVVQMLRQIGPIAAGYGIRVCQEDYDYFTSAELLRICREVGLPNVGIHSDTGNWLLLGEDPVAATRACLPYTLHAHVRDYVLENETYNGVALGEGLVDFPRVLPVLAEAGREEDIIFAVEVDTDDRDEDEAARASYAYLKQWLVANGHTEHVRA